MYTGKNRQLIPMRLKEHKHTIHEVSDKSVVTEYSSNSRDIVKFGGASIIKGVNIYEKLVLRRV